MFDCDGEFDFDGDGEFDFDGDGDCDGEFDFNGDGEFDCDGEFDFNGDGEFDGEFDFNGDCGLTSRLLARSPTARSNVDFRLVVELNGLGNGRRKFAYSASGVSGGEWECDGEPCESFSPYESAPPFATYNIG